MRSVLLAALAALVGVGPATAQGMVLWREATAGMTVAEVRRVVPQARPSPVAGSNKDGWRDLLQARVREGSLDQNVVFQFKEDRLIGAVITMGTAFGLTAIAADEATSVRRRLRDAYGRPLRSAFTDDDFRACSWIKGATFVGYLERPPPTSGVMVFIHPEQAGDRELLKDLRPAPEC